MLCMLIALLSFCLYKYFSKKDANRKENFFGGMFFLELTILMSLTFIFMLPKDISSYVSKENKKKESVLDNIYVYQADKNMYTIQYTDKDKTNKTIFCDVKKVKIVESDKNLIEKYKRPSTREVVWGTGIFELFNKKYEYTIYTQNP